MGKADVEKEEMLDIVTKSTQTLREEYLARLENARAEIERRVAHLRAQKQSQAASLERLSAEKCSLRERAADLSERYEDLQDNGQRLRARVELVLQKLQRQVPIGSDAELRMQRQLQELQRKTREMRSSMERIAAKEKYQMRQIDEENERRRGSGGGSGGGGDKKSNWR